MIPTFDNVNEYWWIRWKLTGDITIAKVATTVFPNDTSGSLTVGALLPGYSEIFPSEDIFGFEWVEPVSLNSIPVSNSIQNLFQSPSNF